MELITSSINRTGTTCKKKKQLQAKRPYRAAWLYIKDETLITQNNPLVSIISCGRGLLCWQDRGYSEGTQ